MPQATDNSPWLIRGIATIVATVFGMALADAVVKYSSAEMTLWQIWVLRSAIVVPVLLVLNRGRILPRAPRWVLLRSFALVLMYLGIYAAIPLLDLSVIAASLYTAPLFITILSAIALREPITGQNWAAIMVGFVGVLLIVQPAAEGFTPLALVPISAAFLYALAAVVTRAKCAREAAPTLALWVNLMLLVCGGTASLLVLAARPSGAATSYPFLFAVWPTMTFGNWQVIGVLAALMIGIGIGLAKAYQSPKPQVIATFDYSFLIFAAFWGYVFFGEIPSIWNVLGMVLIAGAGVIVLATDRPSDDKEIALAE